MMRSVVLGASGLVGAAVVDDVLRCGATRRGETLDTQRVADTRALADALGALQFTGWKVALAETLEWYAQRHADVRSARRTRRPLR